MVAARPIAVVLKSAQLSLESLPSALPFESVEVSQWDDAIERLSRFRAGCVLVDFDASQQEIVAEIHRVYRTGIRLSIIACSRFHSQSVMNCVLRARCKEFLKLPLEHGEVSTAFQRAIESDTQGFDSPCVIRGRLSTLTPREREVLAAFLDGANTKSIAKRLSVTKQTVDKHRKNALEKMEAPSFARVACQMFRS